MFHLKSLIRAFIPAPLISSYHFTLAYLGALLYRFPSRKLIVIGVTGTDGKSSTVEYINAIFEEAGYKTALSSSIRVKIGETSQPGTGRSMPGRFFIQRFMRRALQAECTVAIIEMTSEGVRQYRHRGIEMNALVFTNLTPEHIESHGSYAAYADAKYEIGLQLARSPKRPRTIVANQDDAQGARYLALPVENVCGFSLEMCAPWSASQNGGQCTFENSTIQVKLPGEFSIKNALAAALIARSFGIDTATIQKGIARLERIPGRFEEIRGGQEFGIVVDYALTPDALEGLYKTYAAQKKICVFGSAGGGRDTWKRPILGTLAEKYCEAVILTNDIAYDENPQKIVDDIARDMTRKPEILLDRRLAIRRSLEIAKSQSDQKNTVVLITGMGIDTEISAPDGTKIPWDEVAVMREELTKILA